MSELNGISDGPIIAGNCILIAVLGVIAGGRLRWMRNRLGKMHFYWIDRDGLAWEFHGSGAVSRSYFRNLIYQGRIRRAPSLDLLLS